MPDTRAMLLDIEGTTTAVAFVYEVLFPYARTHLEEFLRSYAGEDSLEADLARLRVEQVGDPEQISKTATEYLTWLMDQDRKSTALKSIQGKIWEEGYRRGLLLGSVYEDVPRAFDRWSRMGRQIAIFSSGSVLAQKLLFGNTAEGDLTGYLDGYFDTTIGPKKEAESYARIARSLGLPASEVLFVSDVVAELEGAQAAGMATALCVRLPSAEPPQWSRTIQSFDEL